MNSMVVVCFQVAVSLGYLTCLFRELAMLLGNQCVMVLKWGKVAIWCLQ